MGEASVVGAMGMGEPAGEVTTISIPPSSPDISSLNPSTSDDPHHKDLEKALVAMQTFTSSAESSSEED